MLLKTSVGTEYQSWGLIWAISFSSFPWCSNNFQAPGQPVGSAADRTAELFTKKDWTPPFAIHGFWQHYHLLHFSSWTQVEIYLLYILGFLVFLSPPNWKTRLFPCWKEAVQNHCPEPRGSAGTERWNSSPQDSKGCWLQRCQKFSSSRAASSAGLCGTCWQTSPSKTHQYPHLQSWAFCNSQDSVFRCSDDNRNTALVMQ